MALHGRLILASRSSRRVELLGQLGLTPQVVPADIDETPHANEDPASYVVRLACEKAITVARSLRDETVTVLAADTTVDVDGVILGQPVDDDDARRMLLLLRGRAHLVHTGVAVIANGTMESMVNTSLVTFHAFDDAQMQWYVATGEPRGKAGGYAIQGLGSMLVASIRGSISGVIGLPLHETAELLGITLPDEHGH